MGLSHSPRIVTNGLVLCVDAANPRSYPGAGTAWTDLSKQGNNGTLTNGPTFDSANGGSILLDGSDDYVEVQGTAEGQTFPRNQLNQLLDFAEKGIRSHLQTQKKLLGENLESGVS